MRLLSCATLLAVFVVPGCATARGRADDLLAHGDYLAAAEAYDRILDDSPNDSTVKKLRTAAREGALRVLLGETSDARAAGRDDVALDDLHQLLATRAKWQTAFDPSIAPRVEIELAAARETIRARVAEPLEAARPAPLFAEQALQRHSVLLGDVELAPLGVELRAAVAKSGQDACAGVSATANASTPYWDLVVSKYCAHFGAPAVSVPPLPHLRAGLVVDGAIRGVDEAENARLRAALGAAFARTLWYGADAPASSAATIIGSASARFDKRRVNLTAPWVEQVPYTDYETYEESHQEPYTDTEYYDEQVPYTDGDPPTTRYRSESQSRTVTKYRTVTETKTRPVTRYRDVPRTFCYQADEHTGHYASTLSVRVSPNDATTAFDATVREAFESSGLSHDVTFEPAGVYPQSPGLPTLGSFFEVEANRLAAELPTRADAQYVALFCASGSFTADTAARCAYAGWDHTPRAAREALVTAMGDDAALVK